MKPLLGAVLLGTGLGSAIISTVFFIAGADHIIPANYMYIGVATGVAMIALGRWLIGDNV